MLSWRNDEYRSRTQEEMGDPDATNAGRAGGFALPSMEIRTNNKGVKSEQPGIMKCTLLIPRFRSGDHPTEEKTPSEVPSDQVELMNGILGSEPVAFDLPHETGRAADGKGYCPLGNTLLQPLFAHTGNHIFVKLRFHTLYYLQNNRFCLILAPIISEQHQTKQQKPETFEQIS